MHSAPRELQAIHYIEIHSVFVLIILFVRAFVTLFFCDYLQEENNDGDQE